MSDTDISYPVEFNQDCFPGRWLHAKLITIWLRRVGMSQNDKLP